MRQLICSYYRVCVFTVKTYKLKIQETEQQDKNKKENKQNWNKNLVPAKPPLVPGDHGLDGEMCAWISH